MARPSTLRTYDSYLCFLGEWAEVQGIEINEMTVAQFEQFCTHKEYKRTSSKGALAAVKYSLTGEDYPLKDYTIRAKDARPTRPLTRKQFHKLMQSLPTNIKGKRDRAIIGLMVDGAPRLSEVCVIKHADLNLDDRFIDFYIPKTNQWHRTVFGNSTQQALIDYLAVRDSDDPALFVNTFTGKQLTPEGLKVTIRRLGAKVNIKLGPHRLRATAACAHTDLGTSARKVQVLGNWSSLALVERYTSFIKADDIEVFPNDAW